MFSFHHPESFLWNESDEYHNYKALIDRTTFEPHVEPVNSSSSSSFIVDNIEIDYPEEYEEFDEYEYKYAYDYGYSEESYESEEFDYSYYDYEQLIDRTKV